MPDTTVKWGHRGVEFSASHEMEGSKGKEGKRLRNLRIQRQISWLTYGFKKYNTACVLPLTGLRVLQPCARASYIPALRHMA